MPTPRGVLVTDYILDLDHTFYDTERMMTYPYRCFLDDGYEVARILQTKNTASRFGYTFEAHMRMMDYPEEKLRERLPVFERWIEDGERFLYPDVLEGLAQLKEQSHTGQVRILTFGDQRFQHAKIAALPSLLRYLTHVDCVSPPQTKGQRVLEFWQSGRRVVCLDNSVRQLRDVKQHVPEVELVRIIRPGTGELPHPEDGIGWRVVSGFNEFVAAEMARFKQGRGDP